MRDVYVYSTLQNGALTKTLFTKRFKTSSAPPSIGFSVQPACLVESYGKLKQGVVTDVKTEQDVDVVFIGTETATEDLRCYLVPEGWKEISGSLE